MHGHSHEPLVGCHIEELPAVMGPLRLVAPNAGNLPFAPRRKESLGIDLPFARLVGDVGKPAPVRGHAPVHLVELGPQNRLRRLIACERHRPDVPIGAQFICHVHNVVPVMRPIRSNTVDTTAHEPLLFGTAGRGFLEQVRWQTVTWGSKYYTAAVRSPNRTNVEISEREARRNTPRID